jgi:hypothetical protein
MLVINMTGVILLTVKELPWHRNEIFHDDVANFPLTTYSFIEESMEVETDEDRKIADENEAGRV